MLVSEEQVLNVLLTYRSVFLGVATKKALPMYVVGDVEGKTAFLIVSENTLEEVLADLTFTHILLMSNSFPHVVDFRTMRLVK